MREKIFKGKRIVSLLLAFLLCISPAISFGQEDFVVSTEKTGMGVKVFVSGRADKTGSISVISDGKYYFIDEFSLDSSGKSTLNLRLVEEKDYELRINIDGEVYRKNIDTKSDTSGSVDDKDYINISIVGYKGNILSERIEVLKKDTVLSVTKRALDMKGIDYRESKGYFSEIQGQREFDKGSKSGWLFRVNGILSKDGSGNTGVKQGDRIEWKYSSDYTIDSGQELVGSKSDSYKLLYEDLIGKKDMAKSKADIEKGLTRALGKDKKNLEEMVDLSVRLNAILKEDRYEIKNKKDIVSLNAQDGLELTEDFLEVLRDKKIEALKFEGKGLSLNIDPRSIKNPSYLKIVDDGELNISLTEKGKEIKRLDEFMRIELDAKEDMRNKRFVDEYGNVLKGKYDRKNKKLIFKSKVIGKYSLKEIESSLKDIEGHWGREDIEDLYTNDIVKGDMNNSFNPNRNITRAEFVALINRLMEFDKKPSAVNFKDVHSKAWYSEDINTISYYGIVKGKTLEKFEPESHITREEMVTIIGRVLERENFVKDDSKSIDFKDKDKISSWSRDGIVYLSGYDILSGDENNNFNPKENATRAEAAKLINRLYNLILENW